MNVLIILIAFITVGVILFWKYTPVDEKPDRHNFIQRLTKLVTGYVEKSEEKEGCFQISFAFEGQDFIFEDVEEEGLEKKLSKAYLKAKTPGTFTLTFTEKPASMRVRSDIFMVSEIKEENIQKKIKLLPPKALESFKIFTNDPELANTLFEDKAVSRLLAEFKNVDSRGTQTMALRIIDGEVILEFRSDSNFYPSLNVLHKNIHAMEGYVDQLLLVIRKLNG